MVTDSVEKIEADATMELNKKSFKQTLEKLISIIKSTDGDEQLFISSLYAKHKLSSLVVTDELLMSMVKANKEVDKLITESIDFVH